MGGFELRTVAFSGLTDRARREGWATEDRRNRSFPQRRRPSGIRAVPATAAGDSCEDAGWFISCSTVVLHLSYWNSRMFGVVLGTGVHHVENYTTKAEKVASK